MPASRIAKAKVAGSNPVFRSKAPGFRVLSGSGLFHGRRRARRRGWPRSLEHRRKHLRWGLVIKAMDHQPRHHTRPWQSRTADTAFLEPP